MAKLLYSCLCLLDEIIDLHAMMKNTSIIFHWKGEVGSICNKCLFKSRFIFCICSACIYYMITLKSLVLIHEFIFKHAISMYTLVFLYKIFMYRGFNFIT